MSSFQEWLRNQKPQRWMSALVALVFAMTLLGRLFLPILVMGGVCYLLLHRHLTHGAAGGSRARVITPSSPPHFFATMRTKLPWIIGAVVVLVVLASSVVVVSAGTTGVLHLFGKVNDEEIRSGIHLVNPLAAVERMSIRTEEFSMTKTSEGGEGDAITVLTKEGLDVTLDLTVLYRLEEARASDVFKEFGLGYRERIIRPIIRSAIRQVVAEFDAKDIYSEKREQVTQKLRDILVGELGPHGITLEEVLLRDVKLPDRLTQSIQEKLSAEQEAQRYEFTLQTAKKEAERKRIEAEGQRDSQKIINESLTQNYLNFKYIESLKDRAGTIYVPTNPANGLPFFQNLGR